MQTYRYGRERIGRPWSEAMGKQVLGFPRNLGTPVVSTEEIPAGTTVEGTRHGQEDFVAD